MRFLTKTEFRIFLIFWVIFSVFAASDRWNDNASLDLTMAIVDEHRFEIDSYANNTGDRAYYNGHYYSDKVPGAAFLAVPLYSAYKIFVGKIPYYSSLDEDNPSWKYHLFLFLAISLISSVCGALTIVLVYKISRYFTSNNLHRHLLVTVLGLGTLLPHAARQFNSHAISTFFIFLSFYLIFKMKKEKTDYSLIAGLSGGFAVLTEYRAIIVLLGLFIIILTLKKWKLILKFAVGVLMIYSILLLYHNYLYGSVFDTYNPDNEMWENYRLRLLCGSKDIIKTKSRVVGTFITFFSIVNSEKFSMETIKTIRSLFDPFKGLFFYSPIILLSLLGLFFMHKEYKAESLVILFSGLIYIRQLASSSVWWGGHSFGLRHLTPIIPFMMLPLLYTFKKINIKIVLFFVIISILINIIGLQSVTLSHDPIIESNAYCERMRSYAPLANPLFNSYIPSILDYNPKNSQDFLILERLLGIKIIPFANLALLFITFLFIWKSKPK